MRPIWPILLMLLTGLAQAASFDCSRARTPREKAICTSPELSAADDRLAAAYKRLLGAVPVLVEPEERAEQRDWLRQLAATCKVAEVESSRALAACMLDRYPTRTKELEQRVQTLGGVIFYWRSITMRERDDADDAVPETRSHELNPGFGTLNASWPQASASTDEWEAWNQAVEKAAKAVARDGSGDESTSFADKWTTTAGVDAEVTASIGLVTPELVTATIENLWDGHGVHPNSSSIQFNWLLRERRELKAADVLRPGSGWEDFLYKRCDRYLHDRLDLDGRNYEDFDQPGEMAKTVRGIVLDPVNWELNSGGLAIVFQDYAVACHACKPPPLTVPWTDLRPYLQGNFSVPQ